jgi:hypothetical protein
MDLVFSPVVEVEAGHIPQLHVLASWRQSS